MKEIEGNIITLAKSGEYDVVIHGCNCFSAMGSGLAPQMAEAFGADKFRMELPEWPDNEILSTRYNKMGCIDWERVVITDDEEAVRSTIAVVNCYSQYKPGRNGDYLALTMCFRKLNVTFKGLKLLMPEIGCGIAGLDLDVVKNLATKYMPDLDLTLVHFKPE